MKNTVSGMWQRALRHRTMRIQYILTLPALGLVLSVLSRFLTFVERRQGARLPDPVLDMLVPHELGWITFGLIYLGLILALATLGRNPVRLLLALQAYIILMVLRIVVMYTAPLEPPLGMILLRDPVVESFGPSMPLTKDLFFSGHTATLFLLFLVARGSTVRWFFLGGTVGVGICVLWQHVHYTVDVLGAAAFAYCAYRIARGLQGKMGTLAFAQANPELIGAYSPHVTENENMQDASAEETT